MYRCDPEAKAPLDPIHLFAGGNIIGSKGLIFALEALKLVSQAGINWRLVVGGHGPEVPFLKKRACALGIQAWIEFHMGFSGSEYIKKLKGSHVFILPSFRENAGITMLEAMLAGCVPIIADASAQADVVKETSGFKIPVGTADSISMGLAKAVETMARNPVLRFEMGRAASRRVAESFTEDAYIDKLGGIYEAAIRTRCNCL